MSDRRSPWASGTFGPFRCRVCGHNRYTDVVVRLPSGASRRTELKQCSSCSVVFVDPVQFSGKMVRSDATARISSHSAHGGPSNGAPDAWSLASRSMNDEG